MPIEAALVEVPVVVELLVSRVQPQRGAFAHRTVHIRQQGEGREGVDRPFDGGEGAARVGRLADAVDDAAAAAPAEDQRVGALQHLDPLDVVEGAVILRVVAQAVEVEVGGGLLAADEDLVPVALARSRG